MRKIIPVLAAGATALALAGGTFGYAALGKDVTLSVDGSSKPVSTRSDTVADVLTKQGITLGEHDVVAPAVSAPVADGTRIAVQYGRPVHVKVDGRSQTLWTTATRVDQALAALSVNTSGAALSTSPSAPIGREGVSLDVGTLKTVTVAAAGQQKQVKTTGQTVSDVLQAAKITADGDDQLSKQPNAPVVDGASFTYTKVDARQLSKKERISYGTVYQRTSRLAKDERRVDTSGRSGIRTLTYRELRHDGKVKSIEKIDSEVARKPQPKVVLIGTKAIAPKHEAAPEVTLPKKTVAKKRVVKKRVVKRTVVRKATPARTKSSHPSRSSSSPAPRVSSGGVWDKIAKCESGGNWSINTGNGFYGGLQFTVSTWRAFGGSGMPHHASRSRQIAVAKKIQASQGWGAWPACTAKLGLR